MAEDDATRGLTGPACRGVLPHRSLLQLLDAGNPSLYIFQITDRCKMTIGEDGSQSGT